jgi:hypothetical protein
MWFILQGTIIFGVFCWIGQHVDYVAQPEYKKAAGMLGGLVAFAVTFTIVYAREFCRDALHRCSSADGDNTLYCARILCDINAT